MAFSRVSFHTLRYSNIQRKLLLTRFYQAVWCLLCIIILEFFLFMKLHCDNVLKPGFSLLQNTFFIHLNKTLEILIEANTFIDVPKLPFTG